MIDKVFEVLKKEVYNYLLRLPELNVTSETIVHTTPIIKFDGSIAVPDNSLGLTLVNVEEERVVKSQKSVTIATDRQVSHINPEIKLNLYMLITANFNNYNTGLGFLSGAIRFFQSKNVFTHENTPDLHPDIEKLIAELYSLNFEQQNHLWSSLGAKYLPSVMYRLRMITIQEVQKRDEQIPISTVNLSIEGTY